MPRHRTSPRNSRNSRRRSGGRSRRRSGGGSRRRPGKKQIRYEGSDLWYGSSWSFDKAKKRPHPDDTKPLGTVPTLDGHWYRGSIDISNMGDKDDCHFFANDVKSKFEHTTTSDMNYNIETVYGDDEEKKRWLQKPTPTNNDHLIVCYVFLPSQFQMSSQDSVELLQERWQAFSHSCVVEYNKGKATIYQCWASQYTPDQWMGKERFPSDSNAGWDVSIQQKYGNANQVDIADEGIQQLITPGTVTTNIVGNTNWGLDHKIVVHWYVSLS